MFHLILQCGQKVKLFSLILSLGWRNALEEHTVQVHILWPWQIYTNLLYDPETNQRQPCNSSTDDTHHGVKSVHFQVQNLSLLPVSEKAQTQFPHTLVPGSVISRIGGRDIDWLNTYRASLQWFYLQICAFKLVSVLEYFIDWSENSLLITSLPTKKIKLGNLGAMIYQYSLTLFEFLLPQKRTTTTTKKQTKNSNSWCAS